MKFPTTTATANESLLTEAKNTLLEISFNEWVTDVFSRKARFDQINLPKFSYSSLLSYYSNHLYFVTMHFRHSSNILRDRNSRLETDKFFSRFYKGWYMSVCRKLLGTKYHKKSQYQPFSMAFLDVEGSRHRQPASIPQMPHIHALMLIHPKNAGDFKNLLRGYTLQASGNPAISTIDIRPFKDKGHGPYPIMTYATKYARTLIGNDRAETAWGVFPDLEPRRYPFYKDRAIPHRQQFLHHLKRYS